MKMKKSLLSVVFLLATSSAMAAMSFSTASVTSGMSFSIENTNEALLALEESTEHNASYYNTAGAGKLMIDLDKGYDNGEFGIQNNSDYTWDSLFTVKNNSEHTINVSIKTDPQVDGGSGGLTQGINTYLSGESETSWTKINGMYNAGAGEYTFSLAPNTAKQINLKLESIQGSNKHATPGEKSVDRNFKLIVDAEKAGVE